MQNISILVKNYLENLRSQMQWYAISDFVEPKFVHSEEKITKSKKLLKILQKTNSQCFFFFSNFIYLGMHLCNLYITYKMRIQFIYAEWSQVAGRPKLGQLLLTVLGLLHGLGLATANVISI